ncbi:hypothetical protein DFH08DRAFT_111759 [Mycena albidolilacea]|uniref:Uncharacterized protein n=1 Tax=Mycena albidolilacea TaxID=1033008 RepID=A0AAD7A711_9AGAR|nr:hypothetical protein DFH08DRAFT_111759 [Mycena albidolilacea]
MLVECTLQSVSESTNCIHLSTSDLTVSSALFNEKGIPFQYVASFVRLGHKYDFKALFDIAVERLAFENPTTLEEYVALLDALRPAIGKTVNHSTTRIVHYAGIHYDMLTLARENNLLAILPCAYYRFAKGSLESIFREIQSLDGTVSTLSALDRITCALGHERLLQAQWQSGNSLGWLIAWKPAPDCKNVSRCQRRQQSRLNTILISAKVHSFIRVSYVQKAFCAPCAQLAETPLAAGRAKMWEDLPSFSTSLPGAS